MDPLAEGGRGKELVTSKLVVDETMPLDETSRLEKVDNPCFNKIQNRRSIARTGSDLRG